MAALRSLLSRPAVAATREQLAQLCRSVEDGGKQEALVSGFDELDRRLPRGGWPLGALIELLCFAPGIGELSLLLPAPAAWPTTVAISPGSPHPTFPTPRLWLSEVCPSSGC